jgi:hypothetical protein
VIETVMNSEVQEFLSAELVRHAMSKGFAFLLDQMELVNGVMDRFDLNRSDTLWEMTMFIQENAGPEGDLAIIEKEGRKYFQWRYVEWPSWLPDFVNKPKWHRKPAEDRFFSPDY